MKQCPQCQHLYADELKFCLADGAQLAPLPNASEERTVFRPLSPVAQTSQLARRGGNPLFAYLSAGLFALLIGGAVFAWMKADSNSSSIVKDETSAKSVSEISNKQNTKIGNYSESNKSNFSNSSANTATTETSFSDESVIKSEVRAALNGWVQASVNRNLEALMDYYAYQLETYYRKNNADVAFVRKDKSKAFERLSVVDLSISNLVIDVSSTNGQVITTFDKTFDSRGDTVHISGAVKSQLRWGKKNGDWKIISEKDLQIYRVNKQKINQ